MDTVGSGDVTFTIRDPNFHGGIVELVNKTVTSDLYTVTLAVGQNVTASTFDYDVCKNNDMLLLKY